MGIIRLTLILLNSSTNYSRYSAKPARIFIRIQEIIRGSKKILLKLLINFKVDNSFQWKIPWICMAAPERLHILNSKNSF